ncbi:hypothetical protein WJX81_007149 [Elliptochloris bilobata]|uniref:Selenoprotein F n=1 Tax=Elliptochloris bilobata TaxID=381761 RepID=A0AAW1R2X6_9CHLO
MQHGGFTGSQLCSTCDQLEEALGEAGAELVNDCFGCCVEGGAQAPAGERYAAATLEVCRHRLREFPEVEKFVQERAAQVPGLTLAHRLGSVPRIRLHGAKGEGDSARVDRWQLADIEAYLADRLEGYTPADA